MTIVESDKEDFGEMDTSSIISNISAWFPRFTFGIDSNLPSKVFKAHDQVHGQFVKQLRTAITGDPSRRIRDNMDDVAVQTKVKTVDSLSFSLGVVFTHLAHWIFFQHPQYFPYLYYVTIFVLFVLRFFSYYAMKYQFFLIDFCYFFHLNTWIQNLICGLKNYETDGFCEVWFQSNYLLSFGPLFLAVIGWHNSLVFHSLDKITSFVLHVSPCLLYFLILFDDDNNHGPLTFTSSIIFPLITYLIWQFLYLSVQYIYIDKDPTLMTSTRYLMNSKLNPSAKILFNVARKLKLISSDETIDVKSYKVYFIFAFYQFAYTITTLLISILLYNFYWLNVAYILAIIYVGVWNGATYYIHKFSQIYNTKFEKHNNEKNE